MIIALRRAVAAIRRGRALRTVVGVSAIAVVTVIAPIAAQYPEAAADALKNGDLAEAKAQFGQAAQRNPADYKAVLLYASTLPVKEALQMADSISRAANAPVWAKAAGQRIVGDHRFLREDYKKAADAYLQASTLDSTSSIYKLLYALSIAMDGRMEAAMVVLNGMALDKNNEFSGEAARILALLPKPVAPVNQPNNASISTPSNAVKVDEAKIPSVPIATATPPVAPVNQQNNASVSTPSNVVKVDEAKKPSVPMAAVIPPAAPVNQQNNASVSTPSNAVKANDAKKPAETVFTIQVGAFASKENADNLVRRLTGKYEDITVTTSASGDQTLYRVRVGTFPRKEDAVVFADKLIIEAGLSARVTER